MWEHAGPPSAQDEQSGSLMRALTWNAGNLGAGECSWEKCGVLETTALAHSTDVILLQEISARIGNDGTVVLPRALRAAAKTMGMEHYALGEPSTVNARARRGRPDARNCVVTL